MSASLFGPSPGLSFTAAELTAAINAVPLTPQLIRSLGVFTMRPLSVTTATIEMQGDHLALIPEQPRGAPANRNVMGTRALTDFRIPHFPLSDTVMADSVQDRRAFGGTGLQSWSAEVQSRLVSMSRKFDLTEEHLCLGAIRGRVVTSVDRITGAVLGAIDLFAQFGIAPAEPVVFPMAGAGARTADAAWGGAIMAACRRALRHTQAALQSPAPALAALCGSDFYDALSGAAEVRQSYLNTSSAGALREDGLFQPLVYGGIRFHDYGGAAVGGHRFIEPDECAFVPIGVPDLFVQAFAPADYFDTVNTPALPRYARSETLDFNKGVEIECQTNTLPLCTNPGALLTGKLADAPGSASPAPARGRA